MTDLNIILIHFQVDNKDSFENINGFTSANETSGSHNENSLKTSIYILIY